MMTNDGRRRAILVFATALPLACIQTQLVPNENHCAQQHGDEWCAEQHPDGSRPFCLRGHCPSPDLSLPVPADGCISERPSDDTCYSPCGGASSFSEDATCLSASSSSDSSTTGPESSTTTLEPQPVCGDGIIDLGEACDDADLNGELGHCALDCRGPTTGCGDGLPQRGEACDDGNAIEGDGCNPDCRESGALVWEQQLLFVGFLHGIDVAPGGAVYLGGSISSTPSQAWGARLDDHDGMLDWIHWLQAPSGSVLYDAFYAAHAVDDALVVFAGRHGDTAYVVVLDETGSFLEDAYDPSATFIAAIADIGTGYLAKRGDLAVRYNYALTDAWTATVGFGLAFRPGDDVALATPLDAPSFRRFFLDGTAYEPVQFPVPAGLAAQSRFVAWAPDGDVVVAGLLTGEGAQDAFALRSSPAGDLRWIHGIESQQAQQRQPSCLAVDAQGAVIVGGYASVLSSTRPFLMKLGPDGDRLWTRSLELTSSTGRIYGCDTNAANEILAVGEADGHMWIAKVTP
jgi:cysteine-rich repeat protein